MKKSSTNENLPLSVALSVVLIHSHQQQSYTHNARNDDHTMMLNIGVKQTMNNLLFRNNSTYKIQ